MPDGEVRKQIEEGAQRLDVAVRNFAAAWDAFVAAWSRPAKTRRDLTEQERRALPH